ncbi:MAG: hypothetical protein JXB47_18375 [Anaerolineae bacterium]|nr:hypothetical protein [Anaerolineae bacterium]
MTIFSVSSSLPVLGQEKATCPDFAFNHVTPERRDGNGIATLSFEWTPVAGATWYRLKVASETSGIQREYLFNGDLGAVVPMGDFMDGNGQVAVGNYVYELTALDANQNELCRSAQDAIEVDQVFSGTTIWAAADCLGSCMDMLSDYCAAVCEGDPECLAGCAEEMGFICQVACMDCNELCGEECLGDPACMEECIPVCEYMCGAVSCAVGCLGTCGLDEVCLDECLLGCTILPPYPFFD